MKKFLLQCLVVIVVLVFGFSVINYDMEAQPSDSQRIQEMVDEQDVVELKVGKVYRDVSVEVDNNTVILGNGAIVTIPEGRVAAFYGMPVYNVRIQDITFIGHGYFAINLSGNDHTIQDVYGENAGFMLKNGSNNRIINARVMGFYTEWCDAAIVLSNVWGDSEVINSSVKRTDKAGILVSASPEGALVANNVVTDTGVSGIYDANSPNTQYVGNRLYRNGTVSSHAGISVSSRNVLAVGNYIFDSHLGFLIRANDGLYVGNYGVVNQMFREYPDNTWTGNEYWGNKSD